ncbi:Hypothetical protein IALB_1940 [Ignavibacterium album JCM 16511]|uniref:Transporter n=1 Tax=Ignavibacterium album (strain DSM 19864 / JCM 16511 / NBRC 101810 / Mat9-16) TaxID=945713 RepID=I0AKY9_IGNAJ|nr:hypothetical protein [Ignavibacterium album]AFH49646.1 Hypothetical protein IALB_1940 [Ignavibacterium album JCM 16511]
MKRFASVIWLITIVGIIHHSYAQGCCTAGSSTFGGLERGISKEGTLNLGLGFINTSLNATYYGREKISDPLNRISNVSSFNAEIEYGLAAGVSVLIVGNFSIKNRETTVRSSIDNSKEELNFEGKGVGDLIITGKYEIITPTILSSLGLTIGGGVKLPVGSYTQEVAGSRLAIDLQPGTGSTDVLLWANFYKGFQPLNFALILNSLYRYAGSNLDGYRFGDELIMTFGGEYYIEDYLILSSSLRFRFANKDFWGGRFLPSTGGAYVDFTPGLVYTEKLYNLKAFIQLPVYRNVQGIQLTTSVVVGAELLFKFNLIKENR